MTPLPPDTPAPNHSPCTERPKKRDTTVDNGLVTYCTAAYAEFIAPMRPHVTAGKSGAGQNSGIPWCIGIESQQICATLQRAFH